MWCGFWVQLAVGLLHAGFAGFFVPGGGFALPNKPEDFANKDTHKHLFSAYSFLIQPVFFVLRTWDAMHPLVQVALKAGQETQLLAVKIMIEHWRHDADDTDVRKQILGALGANKSVVAYLAVSLPDQRRSIRSAYQLHRKLCSISWCDLTPMAAYQQLPLKRG